jgi:putative membrane protein
MKKMLSIAICLSAVTIWSCSDNNTAASGTATDTSANMTTATDTMNHSTTTTTATNPTNMSSTPLSKMDSMFVMEAAVGGMEEVELGNVAQQNAANDRVKAFGAMMVRDHSKANGELMSFAASHGLTIPAALPAAKQKDVDNMKKMTGKSFDSHYVPMMVDDHKTDIAKFKKAAENCNDGDLKTWASKTLPTLETHLDSIQAIHSAKL